MSPATEKRSAVAPDYKAFIESLELYTIGLAETNCKLDRDEYWNQDSEIRNNFEVVSKPFDVEVGHFDVRSTLKLEVTGEKSKAEVLQIVVSFDMHFHSLARPKDFIDKFCDSDLLLIVMPYFREFVTEMTGRMHIPPIILPLSKKAK